MIDDIHSASIPVYICKVLPAIASSAGRPSRQLPAAASHRLAWLRICHLLFFGLSFT